MLQVDNEQQRQLNSASGPNLQNSRKSTLLTAHSGRVAKYRTRLQNKIETKQEQKRKQDYQKKRKRSRIIKFTTIMRIALGLAVSYSKPSLVWFSTSN